MLSTFRQLVAKKKKIALKKIVTKRATPVKRNEMMITIEINEQPLLATRA